MNSNLISKAVRYALVAGAVGAVGAPSAFAADADQSQNQNSNANQSSTATLGKIEVTGSRIKRTDVETAQPVTIISAAQIKATGLTAIGDVLQQMSQGGAALNTQFNNGGDGETFLDLRNLGAKRVLVLVNGKRWIADIGGAVDTNTIPVSIVDHVEVLEDGASAIYGSDAIAGVVNIITIKDYNGAEANAYMGIYNGEGHHDGKQQEYDFTLGSSGDKGGVVMNVSYVNQEAVWAGNRAISAEPVIGGGSAAGSSGTPSGRFFIFPLSKTGGATQGVCPNGAHNTVSSGSCDMTLISPGKTGFANTPGGPTLSNFRDGNFGDTFVVGGKPVTFPNGDQFNFAPLNYLVTPNERTGLFVQGHYDLADNLTFNTEVLFNRRQSQQVLAPSPLFSGLGGTSAANGQPIGISGSNPYNPFGFDLTTNLSSPCVAASSCDILAFSGRRPLELGNRIFNQNRDTFSFRGGLKGYFNLGGSEWDWDIGYSYGNNSETDITNGLVNTERLAFALGPYGTVGAGAKAKTGCLLNGAVLPGCVPFNWFGGNPSITPAMAKYVLFEAHDVNSSNVRNYTANITGDLFDMPAGPLSFAGGFEYLEEDGFFHPDPLTAEGNTSGNVVQPTDGAERTDAEYIEFSIPLVADAPFMKNINLDVADRWSQFRWNGGTAGTATSVAHTDTTSTGRAALRWQATDSLLMRGSWSQGFRIPSISEFFAGNADSFPSLKDPCKNLAGPFPVPAPGPTNCVSGTPQPNAQIRTTVGGNAALTPEKSIAETAGFVYNPDFLPGFDFSMDYFKINVTNAIGALSAQTILDGCYFGGVNGQTNQYCSQITRAGGGAFAGGSIVDILDTNLNLGGTLTEGIDLQTAYKFPSTSVGDFKASLNWTFTKEFVDTIPFGPTAQLSSEEESGTTAATSTTTGGVPKQRANIDASWNSGNWSASWHVEYVSSMIEDCQATPGPKANTTARCPLLGAFPFSSAIISGKGVQENHIGATFYHDVAGTYHMDSWNTDFTFGIRNLFDKDPPIAMSAFANSFLPTYYRTPGRFFYARVGVKF
jgi:iron complex outermembrane receptor protein